MFKRNRAYGDLRDQEYKRIEDKIVTDTAHGCFTYIAAAVMIFLGMITLTDGEKYFYIGLALFIGGLLIAAVNGIAPYFGLLDKKNKRYPKKYYLYSAVIGNYRNTPIQLFVDEFNTNEKNILVDIQEMIHSNYLYDSYIDYENKELIVDHNKLVRKEKKYCPNCGEEIKRRTKFCVMCGCSFEEALFTEHEKMVDAAKKDLKETGNVDFADNMELLDKVTEYKHLLSSIIKRVEENPDLINNREITSLFNLYVPKIRSVIDNYKDVISQNIPDEKREKLESDLCIVFSKENGALIEIINELNDEDILDISSDIDAIIEKLERDGYISNKES